MAGTNQKKKLLCLLQILRQRTDENHLMSAAELSKALEEYGISAERKSIYSDIETLTDFGIDIVQKKGSAPGYYIASREFEIAELKLLVDAAQASKFITKKKTEELIKKLTEVSSEIMNVPQEFFVTTIKEVSDKNFGIGGKTIDKVKEEYKKQHS